MENRLNAHQHRRQVAGSFRGHHIVWISLLFCGTGIAEATSNFLMPDAIRHFTQNAFIISIILSLNPLFGFVAQPLAGWYSDRIWTPLGRRKPVILFGAACLAVSCLGLPWSQQLADRLPWLGSLLGGMGLGQISPGLAVLAFWILIYQFMVDVLSIMVRSVIGDVVPTRHRGIAFGASQVVSAIMIFATLFWGGKFIAGNGWQWYIVVAVVALLGTLPATLMVKEHYIPIEKNKGGNFRAYMHTALHTPYYFRLCMIIAFTFVAGQLITNYYRPFTWEQLGLKSEEALKPFSWMPIMSLVASLPIAWVCDRSGSYKLMTITGALLAGLAGFVGVIASSSIHLMAMAILIGMGMMAMEIAMSAYCITFMPPDKIGQLSGFANIFRGGPRFIMFFSAGWLIEQFGRNYRIAFIGAILCVICAIALLLPMPKIGAYGAEDFTPKQDQPEPSREQGAVAS